MSDEFYEKLSFLRSFTNLGPISLYKIFKLRDEAVIMREWYKKVENEVMTIDYTEADKLEYALRYKALKKKLYGTWLDIGDGLGLEEFSQMVIEQNLVKRK